ncbi:peptidoglycan-binding protein [Spiribacter halobius]|uniref:Peptidoglycan-binding protein n=1 Tax=Sediminicurvatus halobius TaxID=2182432 RepID=A0A2U2N2C2_9GAMM|nr:peptidoglycan-binding protein [Spiribacter halobius]
MRQRVEQLFAEGARLPARVADVPLEAPAGVRAFYAGRLYEPAWHDAEGAPLPRVRSLRRALDDMDRHGLDPQRYHRDALRRLLLEAESGAGARTDLELLLTDAYLRAAHDLRSGRVDPLVIDPDSELPTRPVERYLEPLREAVRTGRPGETLAALAPSDPGYAALRQGLAKYRRLQRSGGWEPVPDGPLLRPGEGGARVEALRRRLVAEEFARATDAERYRYDEALVEAVQAFQRSRGLLADGLVGRQTLAALNEPLPVLIDRLIVNLERWRWLPAELGDPHIRVNIAGFRLQWFEDGAPGLEMPVIVGRPYRQTPMMSGRMTYLVFNPTWEVPQSIARRDIVPALREDPDYLERMGFQVLQGWGRDEVRIDPETIDWQALGDRLPFRFRQAPGPLNALGRVKFMFPNRFAVYLHDTPARNLFQEDRRAFSSGCIRVSAPGLLAERVLAANDSWSPERVQAALDAVGGEPRTVGLERSVPVHLLYWTAWAGEDGVMHFREDVYGRDARVLEALQSSQEALMAGASAP